MSQTNYTPTAEEQLLLEYVNLMRLDPTGELERWGSLPRNVEVAVSYFGVSMTSFSAQMAAFSPMAPLAWNAALSKAAAGHNQVMIDHDQQSHRVQFEDGTYAEPGLGDRVREAGYDFRGGGVAENVYAYAEDPLHAHAGFVIDWGYDAEDWTSAGTLQRDWRTRGDGIQDPAGHRDNLLNRSMTEIGMAYTVEDSGATEVGPFVVTQNLGFRSGYLPQLLGVVYEDLDGNDFYGLGEGQGGISITASGAAGVFTTTTWGSGGYQMILPAGRYEVSFQKAGVLAFSESITIGAQNVKLDAVLAAKEVIVGKDLIGTAASDHLLGGMGNDRLFGEGILPDYDREAGGMIHRLYSATLERVPDVAGYMKWMSLLHQGQVDSRQMAAAFVGGQEFQDTYAWLDDKAFINLLYQNVLNRAADAEGMRVWSAALFNGSMQRSDLVLSFVNSQEYITSTAPGVSRFIAERSLGHWVDDVYRLYESVLGREPEAGGLLSWAKLLAGGWSLERATAGFTDSPEFKAVYGTPDHGGFVDLLYQNVLGRAADAPGRARWVSLLEGKEMTRDKVVLGFSNSAEFIASTAPALEDWMRATGPDDVLEGGLSNGTGANLLYGGALADEFLFRPVHGATEIMSRNEVMDLEVWDWLRFEGFGYISAGDIRDVIHDRAEGAVFSDQGVEVLFRGISANDLGPDMFLF